KREWRVEPFNLMEVVGMAGRHDLMHAHDARSHTLGALIPRIPLVVSRRVAFAARGPAEAWKYSRPTRFIAVSEFVKSILMKRGVPEEKIQVVYDGVPVLKKAEPAGNPPRVLTLANRGDPQKGLPLAEEAAKLAGVSLHATADLE